MRIQGANKQKDQAPTSQVTTRETGEFVEKVNLESIQGFISSNIPLPLAYHELAEIPVSEIDLFESLERNLSQLQDLQSRMSFMMREIRYQMKV